MSMDSSFGVLFELLRVIIFVFLFLLSSVYAYSYNFSNTEVCFAQSKICSLRVEYPLEFTDGGCGYPGLEVDCNDQSGQRRFMNISNHIYHVRGVDYRSNYIWLVDIDVERSDGGCPQPKRNFSIPSSPSWVNYDSSVLNSNITIFYNCSSGLVDAEQHRLCSKQDTNTPPSYALYSNEITGEGFDWYGNCSQNVLVPVRFDSQGLNYSDAIKSGFYMEWSATGWCKDCERSGGHCWSSSTATGCAFRNGKSYNTTCPRQLTPPPHQGPRRTPPRQQGCSCVSPWKCFPQTLSKDP